ncbi:MFS transporter [Streptomyces nanshensis]|nr:MFS transporter [Streptomyces nanshensis]
MTRPHTDEVATGTGDRPRPRLVLPALCATQITSWGVLYYAFPVLLPHLTAETGWSGTAATGAFSGALLVSALVGIPVGRVLDSRGPRAVMTAGSLLGTASVLAIAAAPNFLVFAGAWLCAGAAMAGTLYPPAFAAVTRWWGGHRVRGLTILTLAGGLASTVFAPITAALIEHMSWRATYVTLAVILAAITIPAHTLALRAPWPPAPDSPNAARQPDTGARPKRPVARTRPFVLLAIALTLAALSSFAVVIGTVPLLNERGATSTQAAWALGLGGLGQTLGRIFYAPFARRTGVTTRTSVLIATGGVTTAALAVVPGPVTLLIALAIGVGMVRGNLTLLQATAVTDRWGAQHYGKLSGILTAPVTIATGLAPFTGAALAGPLGGYPALFLTLAAVSAVAAALALGGTPRQAAQVSPQRVGEAQ